jgi:hypothetical protein
MTSIWSTTYSGSATEKCSWHKPFGGLEMIRQATVDRKAIFVFDAGRLSPPEGWRYEASTPSSTLRVDTTSTDACVTQDDLANSYSLQAYRY